MKRNIFFRATAMIALALTATFFCSCSKDDDEPQKIKPVSTEVLLEFTESGDILDVAYACVCYNDADGNPQEEIAYNGTYSKSIKVGSYPAEFSSKAKYYTSDGAIIDPNKKYTASYKATYTIITQYENGKRYIEKDSNTHSFTIPGSKLAQFIEKGYPLFTFTIEEDGTKKGSILKDSDE